MFGYHDSDKCLFDLWSPVDDPNGCAIENRAFSPYVMSMQKCEDIVTQIVNYYYKTGLTNFNIILDDTCLLSEANWDYIKKRVAEELG